MNNASYIHICQNWDFRSDIYLRMKVNKCLEYFCYEINLFCSIISFKLVADTRTVTLLILYYFFSCSKSTALIETTFICKVGQESNHSFSFMLTP